jgi:hypothetical protein
MPAATPKATSALLTVTATYRVPKTAESAFVKLLKVHWPTLRRLKLVGPAKPVILRAEEKGGALYIEVFDWVSMAAVNLAHRAPEVAAVWDAMGRVCSPRAGKPPMEFPHFERVDLAR